METVDILTVVDGLDNLLLVDMLGQGQLHDETIDIAIAVQAVYTGQQFFLSDVILIADERRLEATSLAGQHLILYVCLGATVVTHEDCCQMGLLATTGYYLFYFFGNLGLDGRRRCFSVNQLHISYLLLLTSYL